MKMVSNINKYSNKDSLNNKGFTLVELLAVIAVLALVGGIVVYTTINVINTVREKSYLATINNVENAASLYALENKDNIFWIDADNSDSAYQCITVQNLIDKGYFKGDILESKVDKGTNVEASDNIYLEMDTTTKTLIKNILLYDAESDFSQLCPQADTAGYIEFNAPSGWAKKKDVTITYKLSNIVGIVSQYKYNYLQDNDINVKKEDTNFDSSNHIENVEVTKNGTIYASIIDNRGNTIITKSFIITEIDLSGPVISINDYSGNNVVTGSVLIPLKLTDIGAGVDTDSFSLSDLTVYVGDNLIDDGIILEKIDDNNYNLKIENYNYDGLVKIIINENMILDNVDNGNEATELVPGISFVNKFMIRYDANGGTGNMEDSECRYGSSCTLRANTFTNADYRFWGWSEDKNATRVTYSDSYTYNPFNEKRDITLYAIWQIDDDVPPTCTINATADSATITATYSDNEGGSGISYYGWSSSYSGTNTSTMTVSATGTVTFYVMDGAGNKGSCKGTVNSTTRSCPDGFQQGPSDCYVSVPKYRCNFNCDSAEGTVSKSYESVGGCNYFPCTEGGSFAGSSVIQNIVSETKPYQYSCSSGYIKLSNSYCFKSG